MFIVGISRRRKTFAWVGEQEEEKEAGIKHKTIEMPNKTR